MARIDLVTHVEAAPERVWSVLVDWERQPDWMTDVHTVSVVGEQREGVGVRIRCRTDILAVPIDDELVVTEWVPGEILGVQHRGRVIRGVAAFELHATAYGTRVVWWEEAEAPFGVVGETLGAPLIVPWVRRVFRRNLAALKRVSERPATAPAP